MAVTSGYIASQQKRYNDAIKANDKDLIGRLEADAKRASYALTKPSAPAKAVTPTPSVKTPTALGASLADAAKSAIASTVDKLKTDAATANAKLATPTSASTPMPTLNDFTGAINSKSTPSYNSSVAQGVYTPLTPAPVQTVVPTPTPTAKVETPATTQVTTPAPTRPSLEKEVGQLPYTPTLDVFKQAATSKYTTDMLNVPQTDLEKQVGLTPYVPSPVAPIAQATQTPLEQEAGIRGTYTPPAVVPQAPTFKDFVEANKQSVVTPTDRVETPTLPATFAETVKAAPTPVVEDKAPVTPAETLALPNDTRKRVMGETFTFDNYKNFLDSFQNASELSPEERAWLDGARQQIFSNYDFLTQEMARIQNVIKDRLNKGLDITDQENYYNTLTNEEMKFVKPMQASITPGMQAGQDLAQGAMGGVMQGIEEATGVDQTGSALDRYAQGIPKLQPGTPLETAQQRMADYQKAFMDAQQKQQQQQQPSMFRTTAEKQVQEDIARQNAQLDLQIKQAEQLRDFNTSEQLRAFQNALNEMNTQNFLNQQAQSQQFANRGLLQSGLLSDAMTRLGIGAEQQLRGLEEGRQANIAKASLDYQQTLDRINQTKADLESGRAKNVDQLTKQLIQDQQSADKYQADILKAQYEQRQGDAKQAFDYVKLIGDQTGYDVSGLLGYVANGDVQGIIQALKDTKNPALSLAGRQIQQELAQKEATSTAQILADQARAAQTWSEINGYISDPTGKAILKNGKVQPTYRSQQDTIENALVRQRIAQSETTGTSAEKTDAGITALEIQRQLNVGTNAIRPLLEEQTKGQDIYMRDIKTGKMILKPEVYPKFQSIMDRLQNQLKLDPNVIMIMYEQYGVPYSVSQSSILSQPFGAGSSQSRILTDAEIGAWKK